MAGQKRGHNNEGASASEPKRHKTEEERLPAEQVAAIKELAEEKWDLHFYKKHRGGDSREYQRRTNAYNKKKAEYVIGDTASALYKHEVDRMKKGAKHVDDEYEKGVERERLMNNYLDARDENTKARFLRSTGATSVYFPGLVRQRLENHARAFVLFGEPHVRNKLLARMGGDEYKTRNLVNEITRRHVLEQEAAKELKDRRNRAIAANAAAKAAANAAAKAVANAAANAAKAKAAANAAAAKAEAAKAKAEANAAAKERRLEDIGIALLAGIDAQSHRYVSLVPIPGSAASDEEHIRMKQRLVAEVTEKFKDETRTEFRAMRNRGAGETELNTWAATVRTAFTAELANVRLVVAKWPSTAHPKNAASALRACASSGVLINAKSISQDVKGLRALLQKISSPAYIEWGPVEKTKALTYEIDVVEQKHPRKTIETVLAEALWRLWNRLVWTDEDVYESSLHDSQIIQELEWAMKAKTLGRWTAEELELACYFASLVSPTHDDPGVYMPQHYRPEPINPFTGKSVGGLAGRDYRRHMMRHNARFTPTERREFMKTQNKKIEELFKIVYALNRGFPGWPAAEQRVDHMPRLIENYRNPAYLGKPIHVEAIHGKNRNRYHHPIHNYTIQPHWELRIVRKSDPVPKGVSKYNWVEYQGTTGPRGDKRNVRLLDPRQTITNRHPTTLVPM